MKGNDSTVGSKTKHNTNIKIIIQAKKNIKDKLKAQPGCMNSFL